MDLNLLLEMAVSGYGDRTAVTAGGDSLTYGDLGRLAAAGAELIDRIGADSVIYIGPSHPAFPVALFAAGAAGVPFIPLNYRLGREQLDGLMAAHPQALVVSDESWIAAGATEKSRSIGTFLDSLSPGFPSAGGDPPSPGEADDVAVVLYTSGTSGTPKAALLRHRNLASYVFTTVEFAQASEDEAALVTVPTYHIAGLANLLSNLYAGRRIVYLENFDPQVWLETIRNESITQAMVVPTMMARVVRFLDGVDAKVPSLRTLAYGGSRMPIPVLEEALARFPDAGFVNAYGLTETSSTIALLSPDDHRAGLSSDQPVARARLGSVGRVIPGVEVEIRDEGGAPLPVEAAGLIFLRGEQVSGEYAGVSVLDAEGWFPTGDKGWVDDEGYLFIEGRADDTIIRGGENVSPAEIEDVLMQHPAVADAAVVGVPDDEWGQRIAAVVCVDREDGSIASDDLTEWVRQRLRSSKTPDLVVFWPELPRTATGKLLRRQILADLSGTLMAGRPAEPEGRPVS
ncbi:MAG TPA: class I adenylate-forming enzyme family protein [Acidimicrobiales bacterium]